MEKTIAEIISIAAIMATNAALILFTVFFTGEARRIEIQREVFHEMTVDLLDEREWKAYDNNMVNGADVVDFIILHKDVCDIVIKNTSFSSAISAYTSGGKLIMGLSDSKNIPEKFWTPTFAYDYIINRRGEQQYKAKLLYDGELSSSGSGNGITGVEFTAQ